MTLIVSFDDGALEMIHGLQRMEYETLTSSGTLQAKNCRRNDKQRLLQKHFSSLSELPLTK